MGFVAHGSASLAGDVHLQRRRVNQAFLRRLIEHFEKHGEQVIERVAQESPGTYLKVLAFLMPRESKVEITNPAGRLSDEALATMIAELEQRVSARMALENAKVINAEPVGPKSTPAQLEYARNAWHTKGKAARAKQRRAAAARRQAERALMQHDRDTDS